MTEAVQTLAGVLLPSATVFLLLLCNDKAVLGQWANSKRLNVFTGAVIWVLVMLSIIPTASVMYPDISGETILEVLGGGTVLAVVGYLAMLVSRKRGHDVADGAQAHTQAHIVHRDLKETRDKWRMPPLDQLPAPNLTLTTRIWMGVLRGYLIVAVGLVVVKVVQMIWFH